MANAMVASKALRRQRLGCPKILVKVNPPDMGTCTRRPAPEPGQSPVASARAYVPTRLSAQVPPHTKYSPPHFRSDIRPGFGEYRCPMTPSQNLRYRTVPVPEAETQQHYRGGGCAQATP